MSLIDTHAHLDEDAFAADLPEVIDRAIESGVTRIITIGTTAASSRRAVEIAEQYASVFAAVGIHPNYAAEVEPGDWNIIHELSEHPRVVGIGETGLDRYWDFAPINLQIDYFRRHLELSQRIGKPFIVHCREAAADVLAELQRAAESGTLNGVMHSFCEDAAMAKQCLALGLHISFAGMLTYKKNEELRQVAATISRDRLLVETDSPYLTPIPLRGKVKRNEPSHVAHTAECLAETVGISPQELAAITTANARRLFSNLDVEL